MEGHKRAVVADVVHQHVDPPVLCQYGLGKTRDVIVDGDIGDVASDASARTADLVTDRACEFPVDLGDLDERPVRCEQPRDAGADARAPAGDHRNPSLEEAVPVVNRRDAVTGHSGGPYAECGTIGSEMTDDDGTPATSRRRHIVRLAVFAAFLLGVFYLVAVARVIDVDDVRRTVAATGPLAPLTYVVVSAALGAIFVPGPILAAGSGLLFGPVLGLFVTLGATVGTAIITSLIGRRAGRQSARELLGPERADRLDALIQRGGLWAVVGQRFIPGVSDALASYAFGAFGVPLWQMAVGAFIGSVPRAFVYTALGASIGDLSSPLAYAAVAIWCATAIVGAFATHRGYRHWRGRHQASTDEPGTVPPTKGDLTPESEGQ